MLVNTFYFVGGLVLLEKEEGTFFAQAVTPLRPGEYLTSKTVTLTGLSLLEALLIVLTSRGGIPNLWALALGVALTGAVYSLYGFIVVARYDAINEYLFPSLLYTAVLSLPLLPYFGLWESPWFYLHPVQAPLMLLQAAFQPIAAWQWLYGLGYGTLWTGLAFAAGRRSFERFVILGAGGP
jgi:fluoroquinolone transport system permease protein